LCDLLTDSTQLFNNLLITLSPLPQHLLNLIYLHIPLVPDESLLPPDCLRLLLELPEHLLVLLPLHLECPILALHVLQLALALPQLLKHTHARLLDRLQEILRPQLAVLTQLVQLGRLLRGKGHLPLHTDQVFLV
jgi:hypothetical protein